uniref:Integrase catalytic domain-containing protein n=1 Tax=Brassica campestris TaxID=3711 RepID=M4DMN8_BRACM
MAKLTAFEDKVQAYSVSNEVVPHQAFYTDRGGYYGRGRGQHRGGYRGRGYSTQGRGFYQQFGQTGGRSSQNSSSRPTCQICGRFGHSAFKCYKRFDPHFQQTEAPQAMAAIRTSEDVDYEANEWYPDTAATHHITSSAQNLQNAQPYSGSDAVIVGNGDFLPITHVGSIAILGLSGTLPLKDVLVCPQITKSLLSVSKLTDDYACEFTFDSKNVFVKDKKTQLLLSQGSKLEGLYRLENPQFLAFYSSRQQSTSDELWHKRLGHPHQQILQHLSSVKAISVNKVTKFMCEPCQLGKTCKLPFSKSVFQSSNPLERIHCDVWGPAPVTSVQGFRYYVIFIDNFSRFSWLYPLKLKSDVFATFKSFQSLVENQFGRKIQIFQSDGGGEFVNTQFSSHLTTCGIQHFLSCPHTPEQNGMAERKHRHLIELGLSMMFEAKLPQNLWVEALFTANFLSNLLPTAVHHKTVSAFEKLNGIAPQYSALRVLGCACYPNLRPYTHNKFDPRSLLCVFVGYTEKHRGYRCFHPPTGRVYISRHVLFDEQRFPYTDVYQHLLPQPETPLLSAWTKGLQVDVQEQEVSPEAPLSDLVVHGNRNHATTTVQQPTLTSATEGSNSTTSSVNDSLFSDDDFPPLSPANQQTPPEPADNSHSMVTRGKVGVRKPNPRYVLHTVKTVPEEPRTVKAALNHPGWNGAMTDEIDTCHETETWSLVPRPVNVHVIGCGWIFKTKLNADGTVKNLRARLVARGNEQEEGVDFLETYSPVVRTATVRMVLHFATVNKWDLKQLDVKNAFLHGDLLDTVYMKQPPGFVSEELPDHVCLLHKAIYGLKQAPRAWFNKFSSFLLKYGFICSVKDPSLFIYNRDGIIIFLLLYVDDMVLTGNDKSVIAKLLESLGKEFRMKDMGALSYFLGIQVQYTPTGMFLNQEKYATDLLQSAGMLECAPMPTPLPLQIDRVPHQDELFETPSYFRSLAGKLQYLTLTRPDLQFAVNLVCQRMHKPTMADFHLLKRVLRYIKGTITMGLHFYSDSDSSLKAFCDSDWAGCSETRRSTGGFCTMLGTNLISWSAQKQDSVSRSSTEAEYRCLSDTAAELSWIADVLQELGSAPKKPAEVFCDNLSAVHLTANPVLHKKSKHFATHYHYAREQVAKGTLVVHHVSATSQVADIFTKSLPQAAYFSLRFKLGVVPSPTTSLRGAGNQY